jgi:flagellar basal-body rod protein FlgC
MGPFDMLAISGSALAAERQRSEVIATNLANQDVTRTDEGGPFTRKQVVFSAPQSAAFRLAFARSTQHLLGPVAGSVRLSAVVNDPAPPIMRYQPGHPDADKDGFVAYPAINPVQEMVDLMGSVRAYQLNASAVAASKQMIQGSIDILKS